MTKNKYLDDLGIPMDKYGTNFMPDDDERMPKWEEEKKEWGFDSRETWNMDRIFVEWLYSHLMMYKEVIGEKAEDSMVFSVSCIEKDDLHTLSEWIDVILEHCRFQLLTEMWSEREEKAYKGMVEALHIFSEIFYMLWIVKDTPPESTLYVQKQMYGFDEREVYQFNHEYAKWMHLHLKMFNDVNIIATDKDKVTIEDKEITLQTCIDSLLEHCRRYLEDGTVSEMMKATRIWAEVFPAFWW